MRLADRHPDVVERVYAQGFFPMIASLLGTGSSAVPFSLIQALILLAVAGLVYALGRGIARAVRWRKPLAVFAPFHRWLGTVAVIVWIFCLFWGLNYSRTTFLERINLDGTQADASELVSMVRFLAAETNHAYDMAIRLGEIERVAVRDTVHASRLRIERDGLARGLDRAYHGITPSLRRVEFSDPKHPRPMGFLLTRLGISGIYSPFTGEATVNAELPDVSIPYVTAHEMAHQRGVAPENEANALAYLACRDSGFWAARYSGAVNAYVRSWRALRRAAPDSARTLGSQLLAQGPREDLQEVRRFWTRHEGPAAQVAERMNDTYLKANRQEDGILSYGRMVETLLTLDVHGLLRLRTSLPRDSDPAGPHPPAGGSPSGPTPPGEPPEIGSPDDETSRNLSPEDGDPEAG